MKTRLKTNGVIIFFAVFLIYLFPGVFLRKEEFSAFGAAREVFGVAFVLLGQILRTSARGYKSENSREGFVLIKGGPYTLVRNPMYLGILLIGLGIVCVLFKWWVAGVFLFIFIIRYLSLIFNEEKKLSTVFSKEYEDYLNKVPRILPSIATMVKRDIAEYLPLKLTWIEKEIGTILAVLLIMLLFLTDIKNEGTRVYFLNDAMAIIAVIIFFAGLVVYLINRNGTLEKDVSNKG